MATVIVVGKHKTREVKLDASVTVIGRDKGVNLDLGDLQVSRRHALLVQSAQGFYVKDLGSRNGVILNKRRIPNRQQARLKNGDVMSLGRTTLIFKDLVQVAGDSKEVAVPTVAKVPITRPPVAPAPRAPLAHPAPRPLSAPVAPARAASPALPAAANLPAALTTTPPGGVSGMGLAGRADYLALRTLVERAERDRVYYRNLALILFAVLVGTLVLVFAWALSQRSEGTPDPAEVAAIPSDGASPQAPDAGAMAPGAPAPRAPAGVELSAEQFAQEVHPILGARCVRCHSYVDRGGALVLAGADDEHTIAANLAAVQPFVVPGAPGQSPLLLKLLSPEEGGLAHDAEPLMTLDSPEWQTLRRWVAGGQAPTPPSEAPPSARIEAPSQARVGEAVALRGDYAGAGAESFRWTLLEKPARSVAALGDAAQAAARLVPDVPGRYLVALIVHAEGASSSVQHPIEVTAAVPSAGARLAEACQRLWGRAPRADELERLGALDGRALLDALLASPELYSAWWERELAHLGLSGKHRPRGEPWASLPRRLQDAQYSVVDVHYAILVGQDWSSRYAGREAYVDALLDKLFGPAARGDEALRGAGLRLYDGHEATLLGEQASGQIGLVRTAVRHPRAHRELLARSYRALCDAEPSDELMSGALAEFQREPSAFFRLLVEWSLEP